MGFIDLSFLLETEEEEICHCRISFWLIFNLDLIFRFAHSIMVRKISFMPHSPRLLRRSHLNISTNKVLNMNIYRTFWVDVSRWCAPTQQAHDVVQRQNNVIVTSERYIDVETTFKRRFMSTGKPVHDLLTITNGYTKNAAFY